MDVLETANQVVAEQYKATDKLLTEFREYFPSIMAAVEGPLPREDVAIEQPPIAKEFAEHMLAADSNSIEEEEEEPAVTEEEYEKGFQAVEKFVEQKSTAFGPKVVSNVFLMKQAWQRHKIELELQRKRGQAAICNLIV